jgi:hypothetical protein
MEKNAFAIFRYNLPAVAAAALLLGPLLAGSVVGPVTGGLAGAAAGASFVCLAVPGTMLARRYAWPLPAGLLAPVGLLVVLIAGCNSVVKTLARGGVWWRDDFYRLDELREGMVR